MNPKKTSSLEKGLLILLGMIVIGIGGEVHGYSRGEEGMEFSAREWRLKSDHWRDSFSKCESDRIRGGKKLEAFNKTWDQVVNDNGVAWKRVKELEKFITDTKKFSLVYPSPNGVRK